MVYTCIMNRIHKQGNRTLDTAILKSNQMTKSSVGVFFRVSNISLCVSVLGSRMFSE